MAEIEIDAAVFFQQREKLDYQYFIVFDQAKITDHRTGFGCRPDLLSDTWAPIAAPAAFEPGEV
jgi:hypothetical protein